MKRTRIKPMSDKRRALNALRKPVVAAVMDRDNNRCCAQGRGFGACHGRLTGHETKSRARAGTDANLLDPAGMLTLCAFHNTWCEDNPATAHEFGLTRHSWESTIVTCFCTTARFNANCGHIEEHFDNFRASQPDLKVVSSASPPMADPAARTKGASFPRNTGSRSNVQLLKELES